MKNVLKVINHAKKISEGVVIAALMITSCTSFATIANAATTLDTGKVMFDDFNYTSASDSKLQTNGWAIRSDNGGPGPDGCNFSNKNISFVNDSVDANNKIVRLTASTDGTAKGTSQAEIYTTSRKFFNGTYAARVRFTDAPVSGKDGAGINETFFTISPLDSYRDSKYSELDFEYLPNGGWGETSGMWNTSWHTFTEDPWYEDAAQVLTKKSYDGWHNLVVVVANGYNTYYIDGVQVAKNGPGNGQADYFLPRKNMTINFNLWFIAGDGENPLVNSKYVEDVDWVYHEKDTALTPDQVTAKVKDLRGQGIKFKDTVK